MKTVEKLVKSEENFIRTTITSRLLRFPSKSKFHSPHTRCTHIDALYPALAQRQTLRHIRHGAVHRHYILLRILLQDLVNVLVGRVDHAKTGQLAKVLFGKVHGEREGHPSAILVRRTRQRIEQGWDPVEGVRQRSQLSRCLRLIWLRTHVHATAALVVEVV